MVSPIPFRPEINLPIHADYYQPRVFFISDIVLGTSTTVTTTKDNDYVVGQLVRLHIPPQYGCLGLSGQDGYVTSIPASNQVVININSIGISSYVPSPTYPGNTQPQICAIGDVNSGPINSSGRVNNGTFIDGSFINISPV